MVCSVNITRGVFEVFLIVSQSVSQSVRRNGVKQFPDKNNSRLQSRLPITERVLLVLTLFDLKIEQKI